MTSRGVIVLLLLLGAAGLMGMYVLSRQRYGTMSRLAAEQRHTVKTK